MAGTLKKDKDRVMRDYQLAYERANAGRRIRVRQTSPGWYTLVDSYGARGKYRIGNLIDMTERLNIRADTGVAL
jgi:hypothetical protein